MAYLTPLPCHCHCPPVSRTITAQLSDCDILQSELNQLYNYTTGHTSNGSCPSTTPCEGHVDNKEKQKKVSYTYSLNNAPLDWIDTFRYLGVWINCKLIWTNHVSKTRFKATHLLGGIHHGRM